MHDHSDRTSSRPRFAAWTAFYALDARTIIPRNYERATRSRPRFASNERGRLHLSNTAPHAGDRLTLNFSVGVALMTQPVQTMPLEIQLSERRLERESENRKLDRLKKRLQVEIQKNQQRFLAYAS